MDRIDDRLREIAAEMVALEYGEDATPEAVEDALRKLRLIARVVGTPLDVSPSVLVQIDDLLKKYDQ